MTGAPPRVDAHHHVWRLSRGDYHWLTPALAPIHRDFGLDELRPHLAAAGIGATVLVQAAPTEAETRFLLEVARGSGGLVRGVVGWADLAAPDAPDRVAALAEAGAGLLKGLRPMLQDIAETGWILRPEVEPGLRAMAAAGLRLDLLVQPRHLPLVPELAARHPGLPLVVDHGAKPPIAAGPAGLEPWSGAMARVARDTGACCKLSGLVTEAGEGWDAARLRPWALRILEHFGPERVMWGSDWPVVELARGGYPAWHAATTGLILEGICADHRDHILGRTAIRFYGLDREETT